MKNIQTLIVFGMAGVTIGVLFNVGWLIILSGIFGTIAFYLLPNDNFSLIENRIKTKLGKVKEVDKVPNPFSSLTRAIKKYVNTEDIKEIYFLSFDIPSSCDEIKRFIDNYPNAKIYVIGYGRKEDCGINKKQVEIIELKNYRIKEHTNLIITKNNEYYLWYEPSHIVKNNKHFLQKGAFLIRIDENKKDEILNRIEILKKDDVQLASKLTPLIAA